MKSLVVACGLLMLVPATAGAELKFTMRTELQKSAAAPTPAPNPLLTMMGEAMTRQVLPEGNATMTYLIGEKGTRVEFVNAAMGQAAGTVSLIQPDGTAVIINSKDQTYWKMAMPAAGAALEAAGIKPAVETAPTGEVETVAGAKCERSTFTMKVDLPIPEAARKSLGTDFPSSIDIAGDTCATTDQFQSYAAAASRTQATGLLAAMGLGNIGQGGIVLRQTLRLGGVELRSVVTEIAEQPDAPELFEIPSGYKEVPAPAPAPAPAR